MKNGLIVDENGTKRWYLDDKYHRENDLPAVEYLGGYKAWYLNDKLHRENDLPAVEYADGTKEWYLNDELHRADGPAAEYVDGYKEWHLDGECLNAKQIKKFNKILSCPIRELPLYMDDDLFANVIENRFKKEKLK